MKVIGGEFPVFFDVDNTLIRMSFDETDSIPVTDPYDSITAYVVPLMDHIRLLKRMKSKGHTVIVWSVSGVHWAEQVVNSLGLQDYVDAVVGKPLVYVDDKEVSEWIGKRVYVEKGWGS